jgi:peroxiredoxin
VGEQAPDFNARATTGELISLKSFLGKFVVLYFFPKAFTPGCRRETHRFRDAYPDLRALGAEVIGISVDDHETQCEFAAETAAPFPMIGDKEGEISRRYGVLRPFLRLDKRVTFVLDRAGVVRGAFEHEFQISKHLDQSLQLLDRLRRGESLVTKPVAKDVKDGEG